MEYGCKFCPDVNTCPDAYLEVAQYCGNFDHYDPETLTINKPLDTISHS